jgi:opacity protein-like surface antigen
MKFITTIAAFALGFVMIAPAISSDLNKSVPLPPINVYKIATFNNFYVGVNSGTSFGSPKNVSVGTNIGYRFNQYLAIEGTYDLLTRYENRRDYRSQAFLNVVPQYNINNTPFTVYALGGVGYGWNVRTTNEPLYNVGAGVLVKVTNNVDIDARYRYIKPIDKDSFSQKSENRMTLGLRYNF